jgi:ABC-type polar amino acid transport system ATPase subunit
LLQRHAAELLDQDDVQSLLDNLGRSSPNLVANVVPKIVPLHTLTTVLRHLLGERVPIVDLRRVLDAIAATPVKGKEPRDLAESIRPALGTILIQRISAVRDPLRVVTIESDLEQLLHQSLKQAGGDPLGIEPGLIRKLGEILATESDRAAGSDRPLVLVTTPALRYPLSLIFRGHVTDLTVLENLQLGVQAKPRVLDNSNTAPRWSLDHIFALFPNLADMQQRPASHMSGGEQQMLTVARTLMGNPLMVLLDEPSEGVAPVIVEQMGEMVLALKAQGVSVLLSEQNTHFAQWVSDRSYTLDRGVLTN